MNEHDTWAVIELQSNGDSLAVLSSTYTNWNDALSRFYQTMVSVAQSSVPEHTVLIMDKVGQVRKIETVYHEVEA
jgi:hypothetical protein